MANHGQVARLVGRAGDAEPTAADLIDPVALEERLVEARARRAAALSRRKSGEPFEKASERASSSGRCRTGPFAPSPAGDGPRRRTGGVRDRSDGADRVATVQA